MYRNVKTKVQSSMLKTESVNHKATHSLIILCMLALFFCLALGNGVAVADDQIAVAVSAEVEAEASKRVNRLSDELKSPFCPGKTLLTCTSYQAFALRKEMTEMILAGKSDAEILAALRDSFGEILENPPQPWYTILVPVMPFILGALIAAWMFSRWLRGAQRSDEALDQGVGEGEEISEDAEHHDRLQALLRDED